MYMPQHALSKSRGSVHAAKAAEHSALAAVHINKGEQLAACLLSFGPFGHLLVPFAHRPDKQQTSRTSSSALFTYIARSPDGEPQQQLQKQGGHVYSLRLAKDHTG